MLAVRLPLDYATEGGEFLPSEYMCVMYITKNPTMRIATKNVYLRHGLSTHDNDPQETFWTRNDKVICCRTVFVVIILFFRVFNVYPYCTCAYLRRHKAVAVALE